MNDYVSSAVAYILFLLSIAGSVSIFVEQLKPLIFNQILTKSGEQVYLVSIYLARSLGAFITLALLGGYPVLVGLVPFFSHVPEVGVWVISVLLISLGADYLHVILDFLYAVRDGSRGDGTTTVGDTTGGSTGDGSTNVTVNTPADTSADDIAKLVSAIKDGGAVSTTDTVGALG